MKLNTWKANWVANKKDTYRKSILRETGKKNYRVWCKIQLQFNTDDKWVYDCRINDLNGRLVLGTTEVGPFSSTAAAKEASYDRLLPLLMAMLSFEGQVIKRDAESAEKDDSRVIEELNDEIPF